MKVELKIKEVKPPPAWVTIFMPEEEAHALLTFLDHVDGNFLNIRKDGGHAVHRLHKQLRAEIGQR